MLSFRSPLIQSKTIARAAAHIEGVFSSASISGRREVCLLGNSKSSRGDNEDEGWAFTSTLSETPHVASLVLSSFTLKIEAVFFLF